MKHTTLMITNLIALLATLAPPAQLAAQQQAGYKLIDIGTFGGPLSFVLPTAAIGSHDQLNARTALVGGATVSTPTTLNSNPVICGGFEGMVSFVNHALEWQNGNLVDLGSLGSPDNCSVAASVNANGVIGGHSENGIVDPVTGFNEIHAVRWENGAILDLDTLGGAVSFGSSINKNGQIAGSALNGIPDPVSMYHFQFFGSANGTQTRAFLWSNGVMQDLGTLGGPDAWSNFVNDAGQVAGFSYIDSTINPTTGVPTTHPFLWDATKGMMDLGTLGGTLAGSIIANIQGGMNNLGQVVGGSTLSGDQVLHPFLWTSPGPMQDLGTFGGVNGVANAINDAGQVIGAADLPGSSSHAFLWKSGVMADLGTLNGDKSSVASAINSQGQTIGYSCPRTCEDHFHNHAVLWQNGSIFDLNKLIRAGRTGLILTRAFAINDRGEIAGIGTPPACSFDLVCSHAFLLIPCAELSEACVDNSQ
jgi:probable HAF family extracellular repeat protein